MSDQSSAAVLEEQRLEALHQHVPSYEPLGSDVEELVIEAAVVAGVAMATLNLLDRDWQHQVATAGFDGTAPTPRADAMCNVVLTADREVYTPDARLDGRFAGSPWVDGRTSNIRFYASFPLRTPSEHIIGTLCVFDTEVHHLSDSALARLQQLADTAFVRISAT